MFIQPDLQLGSSIRSEEKEEKYVFLEKEVVTTAKTN